MPEDFGAVIGLVGVLGNDCRFWYHDARAGVLKFGINADLFALAEATPVNLGVQRNLAVGDEHAGDLLLLHASSRGLVIDGKTDMINLINRTASRIWISPTKSDELWPTAHLF